MTEMITALILIAAALVAIGVFLELLGVEDRESAALIAVPILFGLAAPWLFIWAASVIWK